MTEPSLQLGGGNWAGKSGNLLAYHKVDGNFYADDLTFTRASTGTIVNADGLIEQVPYNLAKYSEQFDNAAWTKFNSSISANATTSPDGTLTADKLVENTATNLHRVGQGSIPVTSGQVYTFSFYVKAAERDELELQRINTSGTVFNTISATTADLTNGTLSVGSNVTASNIASVGDGWYRISISLTAIATGSGGLNIGMEKDGDVSYAGDGVSGVYLWGFQTNAGSTAKPYFPTTTRLNMPRVTYKDNSNGSLILEPQRTNLNTYSEDIPQNYVTTEMSDTFGYSISPNGLQTSTRLQLSNVGSSRYVHTLTGIVSSGTAYNFSCYYKGTQGETAYMHALPVGGTAITKAITFTGEWQRENLTFTAGSASNYVYIVDSRQGGDASDFEVWGAQVEAGSYATSIIPTSGSAVTRVVDNCLKEDINTSIINSSYPFSMYAESTYIGGNDWVLSFCKKVASNNYYAIRIYYGEVALDARANGATELLQSGVTLVDGQKFKVAVTMENATSGKICVNGGTVVSKTNFVSQAVNNQITDLLLGQLRIVGDTGTRLPLSDVKLYNTALTDQELITLTTL